MQRSQGEHACPKNSVRSVPFAKKQGNLVSFRLSALINQASSENNIMMGVYKFFQIPNKKNQKNR